jgi:hypothetical protein
VTVFQISDNGELEKTLCFDGVCQSLDFLYIESLSRLFWIDDDQIESDKLMSWFGHLNIGADCENGFCRHETPPFEFD